MAREWVRWAGAAGVLPWRPQVIGSHWSRTVQVDVVAIDWQTHHILLGECTWGDEPVSRAIVRDLIASKAPLVLASLPKGGQGWTVTYALFARSGLTEDAAQELGAYQGLAVDLHRLITDLAEEPAA